MSTDTEHTRESSAEQVDADLLAAPCRWCGYNGAGYYQVGTHSLTCPWFNVGGEVARREALLRNRVPAAEQVEITPELLATLEVKALAAVPQGTWTFARGDWNSPQGDADSPGSVCGGDGLFVAMIESGVFADADDEPEQVAAHCFANGEFISSMSPAVVLALVGRIRELEDNVESLTGRLLLCSPEDQRLCELEGELEFINGRDAEPLDP